MWSVYACVCVSTCVFVHVCVHVFLCMCVHVCMLICVSVLVCVSVWMGVCVVRMGVSECRWLCECVHASVCVHFLVWSPMLWQQQCHHWRPDLFSVHRTAWPDPPPDGACPARPDSGAGKGLRADEVSHHHQVSADSLSLVSPPTFCFFQIPSLLFNFVLYFFYSYWANAVLRFGLLNKTGHLAYTSYCH